MTVGRGVGRKVDRIYTDPAGQVRQQERHDAATSVQQPILHRAIVVEIFSDPVSQLTSDVIDRLEESVKDRTLVRNMPRGAILARVMSAGVDRFDDKPHVFYPLFGQYFIPPLKVGEQVYVMYEDPFTRADAGLWLCRVPETRYVDDLNYTHGDRRFESDERLDAVDKLDAATTEYKPGFPNGDKSTDSLTFGRRADEYERVLADSIASKFFTFEAVPRFNPRPGDNVLQGSNNTLVVLTTDRTSEALDEERLTPGAGAVYVSCGRGQTPSTAAQTVTNTRGLTEVDKSLQLRGGIENASEGDLDLINDKSTLMVSMRSDVDKNFDIDHRNGGEATPGEAASIAMRSDRIRMSAREDVKIQAGTNGEGAAIVLRANGDIILIPGPGGVIRLGGESASRAVLTNNGVASGGSVVGQPIMSTMGGVVGTPADDPHGSFSTKVVMS